MYGLKTTVIKNRAIITPHTIKNVCLVLITNLLNCVVIGLDLLDFPERTKTQRKKVTNGSSPHSLQQK